MRVETRAPLRASIHRLIHYVDSSGRLWECDRTSVCVTDTLVTEVPRDARVVRALHIERGVTTDELRKMRRVAGDMVFREVLRTPETESMLGFIRSSASRFDAAGWSLPALPAPAQPNDYAQILSIARPRTKALGANPRARLREILRERRANIAQLSISVHRQRGVIAVRDIQADVLLELY